MTPASPILGHVCSFCHIPVFLGLFYPAAPPCFIIIHRKNLAVFCYPTPPQSLCSRPLYHIYALWPLTPL